MRGKTVLITGGNAGIGKETALELARRGARVVVVARRHERGEAAVADILRDGGSEVDLLIADFSSLAQVANLAAEVERRYARLDVLVNNAGLMQTRRSETADGFETTFAVNHLAPFLLTLELLELLKRSAPARIVNVASHAHFRARLDLDDLQSRDSYQPFEVYSRSKLANVLFTFELARRLRGSRVTANCLHPGVVRTRFGLDGDSRGWFRLGVALARPFMINARRGAATSIFLATAPAVAGVSGQYFALCRPHRTSRTAADSELAQRLWELSEELVAPWRREWTG